MIICLYHSGDDDGRGSAAIVKYKYPDCKMIGVNYGLPFPWKEIHKDDTVIMADFCLEPIEQMIELSKKCNLIWIDHHVSAMREASRVNFNPEGTRVIGRSGCELTWRFLYPSVMMPMAIFLIGRYDVWDHSDSRTLPWMYGLKIEDTSPENTDLWSKLINNDEFTIKKILERGVIAFDYQTKKNKIYANNNAFATKFDGYKTLAVNVGNESSLIFADVWDEDVYDIMMSFVFKKDCVSISVYTTKENIDVSELAFKYGGGGHAQAAGFSINNKTSFIKQVFADAYEL